METDRKFSLKHGFWYSSFSGVIISFGLALYFLLSAHSEWEALGAGLLAGGFLVIGPFAGFLISAIVAGLVFNSVLYSELPNHRTPNITFTDHWFYSRPNCRFSFQHAVRKSNLARLFNFRILGGARRLFVCLWNWAW